ncbi:asparagine synthetase domain-containing protein CG17486 [Arctopsyche grandis]|uniref:asparagine synthetase domain-containing protein CG17486 n=1 Tax=Arctopsyche grandis TaxID=121162 RepID=UPI00406D8729
MCGIFFKCIRNIDKTFPYKKLKDKDNRLFEYLQRRGPDDQNEKCIAIESNHTTNASERNLEVEMCGCTLWMQGVEPESQPIASKNGCLLFNGDLFDTDWVTDTSDTRALLERLEDRSNIGDTTDRIISIVQMLNGPFSLVYLDLIENKVYFCRDRIGRRSLLISKDNNEFILSSVLTRQYKNATELPSGKIYCMCLPSETFTEFSWNSKSEIVKNISLDDWYHTLTNDNELSEKACQNDTPEEDLELIQRLQEISIKNQTPHLILDDALKVESVAKIVDALLSRLSDSVRTRVRTQPGLCRDCVASKTQCDSHCTVGVLFSGGLDCTILAALTHQHLPSAESIDLFNVAFTKTGQFDTPDRVTSRQSYDELRQLFPERKWNLVEIDVTLEELYEAQKEVISDLIFPLKTILDESLGSALWFAARGKSSEYTSPCRIVLTGIGADELFGGYTRHRNAYKRGGWPQLESELWMDWQRIASRNLARDDRVIGHHGRQPRMPYLDERFVEYVLDLPAWKKCFPEFAPGVGDKLYLRLVAYKLGLVNASTFPKRAIQFGSKIANKKENAKDISQRLLSY